MKNKDKSLVTAATVSEAIDKLTQSNLAHNSTPNQGVRHVSAFIIPVLAHLLKTKESANE